MASRLGPNQRLFLRALDALERERGPDWYSVADILDRAWDLNIADVRGDDPSTVLDDKPRKCPVWFENKVGPHGVLYSLERRFMVDRMIAAMVLMRLTDKGRAAIGAESTSAHV